MCPRHGWITGTVWSANISHILHSVFDIGMYWSANLDLPYIITRCLICGSATIYIHTRHFFGMHIPSCPFDKHFTRAFNIYIHSVFDMFVGKYFAYISTRCLI